RHPKVTVPLLAVELHNVKSWGWVAYTLGLCGGNEAMAALKTAARLDPDRRDLEMIVRGLEVMGESGRAAVEDLAKTEALRASVHQFQGGGQFFGVQNALYPPIPKDAKLE